MIERTLCNLDWKTGSAVYQSDRPAEGKEWNIIIAGDWAPVNVREKDMIQSPTELYGDLLPILNNSDLGIVNVEGVFLSNPGKGIVKDGMLINFPKEFVLGLTSASVHLACLANNHTMDYGIEGLRSTMEVLRANNIHFIGAGLTKDELFNPFIFTKEGLRLAILNIAEGEEGKANSMGCGVTPIDLLKTKEELERLKKEEDFIIIVMHAGREYIRTPPPYIREIYHQLVDFGANLIVGHHPHVYQGIEIYKNAPIFYSLGNFLFYYETTSRYQQTGFILKCIFRGKQIIQIQTIPYITLANGIKKINGEDFTAFLDDLKSLSEFVTDKEKIEVLWNAFADDYFLRYGLSDLLENSIIVENDRLWTQSILRGYLGREKRATFQGKILYKIMAILLKMVRKDQDKKEDFVYPQDSEHRKNKNQPAAVIRNRFDTLAHRELFITIFDRLTNSEMGNSPEWAKETISQWELP